MCTKVVHLKLCTFLTVFNVYYSQQGFSVLSLALTSQALNLVTSLFEDAKAEIFDESASVIPAKLDILENASGRQRIVKIFEVADGLLHFFFFITPIIYRKVHFSGKQIYVRHDNCYNSKSVIFYLFTGLFIETNS